MPSEVVKSRNSSGDQWENGVPWLSPSTVDSEPARQIE